MRTQHSLKENRRERGQTLVLFSFFLVMLILFVGLGIDLGFAYLTRASLSKAVDAACLSGMKNLSQGQDTARAIAESSFYANYGSSGRDLVKPTPGVTFTTDANNNTLIDVSATATINTFFIRILPTWKTLTVSSSGQATRSKLIMSLVLDRSGSMKDDGGAGYMPGAVTNFVGHFDDANDYVSMNSFSQWATTDVTIRHNFKAPIKTAALAMNFDGYTGAEPGLAKGVSQNRNIVVAPGDNAVKVLVFFTDGLANTFAYSFLCGTVTNNLNISYQPTLYDPNTGVQRTDCTIPASIPSINPSSGAISTSSCQPMHDEAERRAIVIADQARADGASVYCIGLASNLNYGECTNGDPPLNTSFLYRVANDPNSAQFNPSTPEGEALFTSDPSQLNDLFETIASRILLRITR
jgi:Flp pilus assembly protein TadG